MFPPRCSVIHRNCSFAVPATTPSSWSSTRETLHHAQHYLVFCCERKFQSGRVLHQLFSTIQVLCFWSTWFCKIELWHWLLKVSPAKAGNNVCIQKECHQLKASNICIQWIETNKQFINQLWTKKESPLLLSQRSLLQSESLCIDSLSILRKQITGKQCILWGWRSDYQPINNMRAHGVLESLLNKATSKPEACIPPCIIQLNTVQALQCFLTKIAEMAM